MDFETFRENLARDIKETLEARTGTDFEVEHRTAEKMNGKISKTRCSLDGCV